VADAAPRPALEHGGLRATGRSLLAGHLGGTAGPGGAGQGSVGQGGADQGGQHGPGARVRALPAWSACARSGRGSRRGLPAGDHLGSRAWPILLTAVLLTPVLLTPVLPGPARSGAGGGHWLRRPS